MTIHCTDGCGRRSKSPATDRWFETFDWSVMSADDPRPPEAATLWFAEANCCWRYGASVVAADLA